MILEYFKNLETALTAKIQAKPDQPNARRKFALETARLGKRLFSENERTAWCGVAAPFDLLNAMGINSCFVEFVGAMLASTGAVGSMLDRAERAGYHTDCCAYHRSVIGAALQGLMPNPDFLIATTSPCSGGLAVIENLARHFQKDLFVLNMPLDGSERGIRYLADQIKDMMDFVSGHIGESIDQDRIRKSIEATNKARDIMVDVYDLGRQVPSPLNSKDLKDFGILMALFLGTDAAVDIAQSYKDELIQRIRSEAHKAKQERIRLLWIQNRIQFQNPLVNMLDDECHATIVVDELNDINWDPIDPGDPYMGIAKRMLAIPLHGPIRKRIEHLQKLASDYQVDGAINPCHWGCRQGTGARGLMQRGLKEIDVPVLNLEVDCIDPRNFAIGQLKTRMEAFFEMIENHR